MDAVLAEEILAWPQAITGCDLDALTTHLTARTNRRLSERQVKEAIKWLSTRGLANLQGNTVRLCEPDHPELELYKSLERQLFCPRFLRDLDIEPNTSVFQNTSTGGRLGDGPLTRPDFTVATIRSSRFDRSLEVTTFEVKNRSGASVASVFAVMGHARLSHFPFLVCPKSRLEAAKIDAIRRTSEAQNIGLILFDITDDGDGGFTTDNLSIELTPQRATPEMSEVQRHLEGRLSRENCARLQQLAQGV